MNISHKIVNVSGENIVYLYVTVQDIYEFGKENFGNGKDTSFLKNIRKYARNNLKEFRKAGVILVINGVVLGTLTLSALMPKYSKSKDVSKNNSQIEIYEEKQNVNIYNENKVENKIEAKEEEKVEINIKEEKEEVEETKKEQVTNNVIIGSVAATTTKKPSNTTNTNKENNTSKLQSTTTNKPHQSSKPSTSTAPPNEAPKKEEEKVEEKVETNTNVEKEEDKKQENVTSGTKIKFNNNGVVTNIDLEEYVIGVVAAEMPAAFHSEALKAQAVVARTYAMKKASKGITLLNSTSHQVYNSVEQMKAKWGSSFNTYYNKIKNAVEATKGKVLKYNGQYIEALYFSMSNGKTELPTYVWSSNYPYLQVVSSSWDENISAAKHTITMTYSTLSSKLGVTVNKDSEIKVLSKTAGDRVNEIYIAGKTFTGVKVRSLLGLRSADFTITKTSDGVSITTIGFGHGVGMSQYGANGAAKSGYTYKQILEHYYSLASIVSL